MFRNHNCYILREPSLLCKRIVSKQAVVLKKNTWCRKWIRFLIQGRDESTMGQEQSLVFLLSLSPATERAARCFRTCIWSRVPFRRGKRHLEPMVRLQPPSSRLSWQWHLDLSDLILSLWSRPRQREGARNYWRSFAKVREPLAKGGLDKKPSPTLEYKKLEVKMHEMWGWWSCHIAFRNMVAINNGGM